MASVYKDGAYWYADINVEGFKRVRKSTKRKLKKEAQKVADDWEREMLNRAQLADGIAEITLEGALNLFVESHELTATADSEIRRDKLLGRKIASKALAEGSLPFHKLTSKMVEDYVRGRKKDGASNQTIKHEVGALSRSYSLARRDYRVNPNLVFERPPVRNVARPFDDQEVQRIFDYLDPYRPQKTRTGSLYVPKYETGPALLNLMQRQQVLDIAWCILHTGCRFGEMASLTWSMVDTKEFSKFTIMRTKVMDHDKRGENTLFEHMSSQKVRAILERRFEERGNLSHVFPSWQRAKVDRTMMREDVPMRSASSINKAISAVEVNTEEKVRIYGRRDARSLRDTFATRMIRNGIAVQELQRLLGHSKIEMTMKYAAVNNETVASKAVGILDAYD